MDLAKKLIGEDGGVREIVRLLYDKTLERK